MININSSNLISNGVSLYNLVSGILGKKGATFSSFTGETHALSSRKTNADIWTFITAFENGVAKPTNSGTTAAAVKAPKRSRRQS